jgi:hypothetical protein
VTKKDNLTKGGIAMRKIIAASVVLLGLLICYTPAISLAQEAPPEDVLYSYGTVSSVSADQVVIKEYDYEKDTEVDITYAIDPAAKFENVASAKEIAVGDTVDIDYVVKDSKKIARLIIVEKATAETPEEAMPPEEIEEELPEETAPAPAPAEKAQ